jgi:uroporphyrinogen decarboxylase
MKKNNLCDGVHSMLPRRKMSVSVVKLRDTYACKPDAPFYHKEFGLSYCLDGWYEKGLDRSIDLDEFFMFDKPGFFELNQLGWCESAFIPEFDQKQIEDRGRHEVIQDAAGRHLLVFKGRRQGFMPEYIEHPVKNVKTWEQDVKWRLDPTSPHRYADIREKMTAAKTEAGQGKMITQRIIGGYMYLRSLIGTEALLYAFHDMPELIHDCMQSWFALADAVTARYQEYVTFDEVFFAEDICYNHGSLISLDMIREFLFPYYQQLINNIKSRQIDKNRHLYVQVDTDGFAVAVIKIYQEGIGMDVMSPFEVASGCDVVEIGNQYPNIVISGGIDKRILAEGKDAINKHLEYILPTMRKRGGYIPTCDHGVPSEVSLENYLHYRQRCVEFGN